MENTEKKVGNLMNSIELLLSQNTELKNLEGACFDTMLSAVDTKSKELKDQGKETDLEALKDIYDDLVAEKEEALAFFDEDIEFLSEQCKVINELNEVDDKEKLDELLSMVIDEDIDLSDSESFKEKLYDQAGLAKKELLAIQDQVEQALDKGDIKELQLVVDAFIGIDDEDLDDDEECEDQDSGCCSSGCSGCSQGCGESDIFDSLKEHLKENK